jgi:single-stranded DNA-binding protein
LTIFQQLNILRNRSTKKIMEQKEETEGFKFPVNKGSVAGVIQRVGFNNETSRATVHVLTTSGKDHKGKDHNAYLDVLISGKERYENFKLAYSDAVINLGEQKPLMAISGKGMFTINEYEGKTHKNYTLLGAGKLDGKNDDYCLATTPEEIADFRKVYHSSNSKNNSLDIRCIISQDPKVIKGKSGDFVALSVVHNYTNAQKEEAAQFADVVIPSKHMAQMRQGNFKKGDSILLTGHVQPKSYTKEGDDKKTFTFTLVSDSIQHSMQNTVSSKTVQELKQNAVKSIEAVASVTTSKKRSATAQTEKGKYTPPSRED